MTTTRQRPAPQPPNRLLEELRAIHDWLRQDLAALQALASAVEDGATPDAVRARLQALTSRGGLFQLKVSCLRYCQLVHDHHRGEDAGLFPAVLQAAPHLVAAVTALEQDHRRVSDLLDRVEGRADALGSAAAPDPLLDGRAALAEALRALAHDLLGHLQREEDVLAPVLATWTRWPLG